MILQQVFPRAARIRRGRFAGSAQPGRRPSESSGYLTGGQKCCLKEERSHFTIAAASRAVHSFLCSRITEVDLEIASLRWTDGPRTECQTSTENCQVFKTTRAMLQTSKTAARFSLPNVSRDERGINETVHVHICEQMKIRL